MTARRGFTLIEVLVTLAIIALLLAILVPTLAAARGTSRDVACRSNQRQMITAWHAFLNEHNHVIPWTVPATPVGAPADRQLAWPRALYRVMPEAKPLVTSKESTAGACPTVQAAYGRVLYPAIWWGYAINRSWTPGSGATNDWQPWEQIRRPSSYPWFLDPDLLPSGPMFFASTRTPNTVFGAPTWGVGFHHANRTANVAFADGSVSPVTQAEATQRQPGSDDCWFDNR